MRVLRHLPRFRQAYRALGELRARERWSRAEIECYQLERLNEAWQHASRHVPHYRALAARLRLPDRFASLGDFQAAVPILTKAEVREAPKAFLSETPGRGRWRFTGGSTGSTTRIYWENAAHLAALRIKYRLLQMWGIDIFDPCAYLWGHGASFAPGLRGMVGRIRTPVEDWFRNRVRLSAYRLDPASLQMYLRRLAACQPAWIYAYASAAYLLAMEAEEQAFQAERLRLVVLTAEPVFPHIVERVERAFGVPAINEYGSIECGVLAAEWPDRTLRVREDAVVMETLPRPDGRYDIVVTVLGNPSFPLFRYAIEDVTTAPLQHAGSGFSRLAGIAGRNNDLVVSRTGIFLHPLWFDDVFENTEGVRRWQVHQRSDGSISVSVELKPNPPPLNLNRLTQIIGQHTGGFPVDIQVVERMPQTIGGKHRWVLSDLYESRVA